MVDVPSKIKIRQKWDYEMCSIHRVRKVFLLLIEICISRLGIKLELG